MSVAEYLFVGEHGIDPDRIVDDKHHVADEFFCAICQGLLWHPRACASCQHLFCNKCIQTWSKTNPTSCPYRCSPYEEKRAPPYIRSLLSRLSIRCRNHSFGCTETLSYDALEEHQTTRCQFLTKQCQTCGQYLLVGQIEEHQASCIPATIRCSICKCSIDRASFEHHESECLQKSVNLFIDQLFPIPVADQATTTNPFPAAPPPAPHEATNENWLTHLTNRLQQTMGRVNLVGYEAAVQARQGNFWIRLSSMIRLIISNPSHACYIIYLLLFVGIGVLAMLSFQIPFLICTQVRMSMYRSFVLIILCSGLFGFGIPFLLGQLYDTQIILTFVLGLLVWIMSAQQLDMEPMTMNQSQKIAVMFCAIILFSLKFVLLMIRFVFWCTPPYITAGGLAWLTIFIVYQIDGFGHRRR